MVILRLTHKTRRRLGRAIENRLIVDGESSTALGDWYINLVRSGHRQLVLCTSAASLLTVVCPAKGLASNLAQQLRAEVRNLLCHIGANENLVAHELAEMKLAAFAKTKDRSVLGSMTEFGFMIQYSLRRDPTRTCRDLSRWLAGTPCSPLDYDFPRERALELLASHAATAPQA